MLRFFVLIALLPLSASADGMAGYDVLGLAKYCETFLDAPRLPAMSTLMNTFGDPLPCVEKRIRKADLRGDLKLAQIDLIDATCWRNKKCPAGAPKPDDLRAIESRSKQVRTLALKYPKVKFQVSPALEHDVKDEKRVRAMLQSAAKGCPECEVINSPFSGAKPKGYKVEVHGTTVTGDLVSGDGKSSFDADNMASDGNKFEHRTAGREVTFMWWPELNLRTTGEKTFTPPLQRTVRPTLDQFRQAYLIASGIEQSRPNAPRQCKKVREVSAGELVKTNAEQYGNGKAPDVRGNKPLLILRKTTTPGKRFNVYAPSGKQVGCFRGYGPYSAKGLYRYYMGDCSGQTPAKLFDQAGGEWAFADLGSECLRFNTIRRMGGYR